MAQMIIVTNESGNRVWYTHNSDLDRFYDLLSDIGLSQEAASELQLANWFGCTCIDLTECDRVEDEIRRE